MQEVNLNQLKAMLQEIYVSTHRNTKPILSFVTIGTLRQPDWGKLTNLGELSDIVLATRKALPVMKDNVIEIDNPVWKEFEDIYYQRVVQPIFS